MRVTTAREGQSFLRGLQPNPNEAVRRHRTSMCGPQLPDHDDAQAVRGAVARTAQGRRRRTRRRGRNSRTGGVRFATMAPAGQVAGGWLTFTTSGRGRGGRRPSRTRRCLRPTRLRAGLVGASRCIRRSTAHEWCRARGGDLPHVDDHSVHRVVGGHPARRALCTMTRHEPRSRRDDQELGSGRPSSVIGGGHDVAPSASVYFPEVEHEALRAPAGLLSEILDVRNHVKSGVHSRASSPSASSSSASRKRSALSVIVALMSLRRTAWAGV